MPRQLSQKQRLFIAELQKGANGADAAKAAGYSPHAAKFQAYRLMQNELVRAELDKVRQNLAAATEYNGERCMAELDSAIAFAKEHKQANAVVKAVELRARLAGLLRDKLDVTVEQRVDINDALEAARARAALRLPCDPAATIEGEFQQLPGVAGRGSVDCESTRLFSD
ncbi:terminase small subunit [Frateuria terrea]|jgi:phage terminase small subunit|uniref:terminase small subunit n=1 Tax=Frateuria terrea TaxID=529704 RepID=UPI0008ED1AFD|nr:terminase small subunit [Frateuria terrea]SFP63827.1 Terminase small subunit [Frateuria terrea]